MMNLNQAVDVAVEKAKAAASPFTPSHAQIAQELQPIVNELLAMDRQLAIEVFRGAGRIAGTWMAHVLAECKSAWRLEDEVSAS